MKNFQMYLKDILEESRKLFINDDNTQGTDITILSDIEFEELKSKLVIIRDLLLKFILNPHRKLFSTDNRSTHEPKDISYDVDICFNEANTILSF